MQKCAYKSHNFLHNCDRFVIVIDLASVTNVIESLLCDKLRSFWRSVISIIHCRLITSHVVCQYTYDKVEINIFVIGKSIWQF